MVFRLLTARGNIIVKRDYWSRMKHCKNVRHPHHWQRSWCYQDDREVVGSCWGPPAASWTVGRHTPLPSMTTGLTSHQGTWPSGSGMVMGSFLFTKAVERSIVGVPHLENTWSRSRWSITNFVARVYLLTTEHQLECCKIRGDTPALGWSGPSTSGLELPAWLAGKTCLLFWCTQPPWSCHPSEPPHGGGGTDRSLWHHRWLLSTPTRWYECGAGNLTRVPEGSTRQALCPIHGMRRLCKASTPPPAYSVECPEHCWGRSPSHLMENWGSDKHNVWPPEPLLLAPDLLGPPLNGLEAHPPPWH